MALFRMGPMVLGSGAISGIQSYSHSSGLAVTNPTSDGRSTARIAALIDESPSISATTLDVAGALSVLGMAGYVGASKIYFIDMGDGGAAAAGSVHTEISLDDALTVPRSLTVSQDGNATLSFESFGYESTGASPVSFSTSSALPSGIGTTNLFGIGPVTINGAALTNITDISIDFGVSVVANRSDGAISPKLVTVNELFPVFSITCNDPDAAFLAPATISSTTTVGLRKRAAGGRFVADGTGAHIEFTIAQGIVRRMAATGGNPSSSTLAIVPTDNANDAQVAVATDATFS